MIKKYGRKYEEKNWNKLSIKILKDENNTEGKIFQYIQFAKKIIFVSSVLRILYNKSSNKSFSGNMDKFLHVCPKLESKLVKNIGKL